jgi:tRNA/tmRNA/rRNA uracil-C5-methylase (TrmA/RlmC/RlmD family)
VSDILELQVERPVAGGRMLARHEGRIVFVSGAIPGERVRARVERGGRQAWFAATVDVLEASPDRRTPRCDPACGGSTFAHIAYARQRALKQEILIDAFHRLARIDLPVPPAVSESPELGYRLRARLHIAGGRVGYYLEGTHTLCDAAPTGQLREDSVEAATTVIAALGPLAAECQAVIVSENIAALERVIHIEPRSPDRLDAVANAVAAVREREWRGVTGVTMLARGALRTLWGRPTVSDSADQMLGAGTSVPAGTTWTRSAPPFFQGNRFLIGALVSGVLDAARGDRVVDLYAGVGLFSVALAATGARVLAVEGDSSAVADLRANASQSGGRVAISPVSVEEAVQELPEQRPDVIVLDPPRTGASAQTIEAVASWRVPTLVYVSCDPPTLARDAARLAARGYRLAALNAYDMFPNTPHVEAIATFTNENK